MLRDMFWGGRSLRVWLFFSASLVWFLVLAAALFVVLTWGSRLVFGRRRRGGDGGRRV